MDIDERRARQVLAIQMLADVMEMYSVELETECKKDNSFVTELKHRVIAIKNKSKDLRKSSEKFFKEEQQLITLGEACDSVKAGVDDFLDLT